MSTQFLNQATQMRGGSQLQKYERDKIHRSVTYNGYVTAFAGWAAWYGFMIGWGITVAYLIFDGLKRPVLYSWQPTLIASFSTGVTIAGFVGLGALFIAKQNWGEMMTEYEGAEFVQPTEQKKENLVLYNGEPMVKQRRSKELKAAGYSFVFTGRNLDMLYEWFKNGNDTVRKISSSSGDGFDRLPDRITSSNYTTALYVLQRGGCIDENKKWTNTGVGFLKQI